MIPPCTLIEKLKDQHLPVILYELSCFILTLMPMWYPKGLNLKDQLWCERVLKWKLQLIRWVIMYSNKRMGGLRIRNLCPLIEPNNGNCVDFVYKKGLPSGRK